MDPDNTPALEPPPNTESNLIDPYSLQSQRIVVASIGLFLGITSVVGRLYVRALMKKVDLDDGVLVLSAWNVSVTNLYRDLHIQNTIELIFCPTILLVKYVLLHQIENIFYHHHQQALASKFIKLFIWANFLLYAALEFAMAFSCIPREKIWHPDVPGHCINSSVTFVVSSSANLVSDLIILTIPIAAIWDLQMALRGKIRVAGVFAVGIIAPIASIMRLCSGIPLFYSKDITWVMSPIGQWAIVEITVGYLVAFSPYLLRLIQHIRGLDGKNTPPRSSPAPSGTMGIQVERSWAVLTGRGGSSDTSSRDIALHDHTRDGKTSDDNTRITTEWL
ncbi:hypothetical protein F5Y04DRAFT_292543 [Hypomontagnella monticulosa]|nr:hypothetical protein F5Y04DRAFT_292543 [Hypomontagnella monticulosa]